MLKIMTFNLRVSTPNDGINDFFQRAPRVLQVIHEEAPDLIGFQEDKNEMRAFLRENLPEYTILGCGSYENLSHAGNSIAYRTDRFEVIDLETKWFSETPNVFGSTYGGDQSKYPRCYRRARLHALDCGEIINFINLHTDHLGENARMLESRQLIDVIRACGSEHVFVTGDFNAKPESAEIRLITEDPTLGMIDATKEIDGSFHAYGKVSGCKVDYVFSDLTCTESHAVEDIPVNGVYISDHNPVVATFALSQKTKE